MTLYFYTNSPESYFFIDSFVEIFPLVYFFIIIFWVLYFNRLSVVI